VAYEFAGDRNADDPFRIAVVDRNAGMTRFSYSPDRLRYGGIALHAHDLRTMGHDGTHGDVAEAKEVFQEPRLVLLQNSQVFSLPHDLQDVLQGEGAFAPAPADAGDNTAESTDEDDQRRQDAGDPVDHPDGVNADELVVADRQLFGGHLGEDEHHQGKNSGHDAHRGISEQLDGYLCGQRTGADVHQVVADKHRCQQTVRAGHELSHQLTPAPPTLLYYRNLRRRERCEGRLRPGEKTGGKDKSCQRREGQGQAHGALTARYRYSTFSTSFIACLMLSLGNAPTAICGLSPMGMKSIDGILCIPNIPASSCSASVSTL